MEQLHKKRVIIIGSGPAGLTSAIYASRAELDTTVITGNQPGGQLTITSEVENYPGFAEGIQGPELMDNMRRQAERFGTKFVEDNVTAVDFSGPVHKIFVEDQLYEAEAIVIATGASALWLNVPGEQRLRGRGISGCATCDGFFFRGKEIAIVGGGDSALEEALYLTRFASKVTILHRSAKLRASKIMQERVLAHPKIEVRYETAIEEALGESKLEALRLRNTKTGEISQFELEGLFVAIGHRPNTDLFKGWLEMNGQGYLILEGETGTKIPGVFVAGDVFDYRYRQAITAAASGCKAALDAENYLEQPADALVVEQKDELLAV
jgi:thioredoxin reductase (NADPH)